MTPTDSILTRRRLSPIFHRRFIAAKSNFSRYIGSGVGDTQSLVHRVSAAEVEQALTQQPILIYEQAADGEVRYVYYGETERNRLLAIVLTERGDKIRVITAYDLDAGQKRDYLEHRTRGE